VGKRTFFAEKASPVHIAHPKLAGNQRVNEGGRERRLGQRLTEERGGKKRKKI